MPHGAADRARDSDLRRRGAELVDAETERRAAVRSAILTYLEKHPRASDTIAGIWAWWLRDAGVTATGEVVKQVLDALVEQQCIRRVQLADGTVIYCARPPKNATDCTGT
jgi:Fe2+ or Zn2+ uptake regulation protein